MERRRPTIESLLLHARQTLAAAGVRSPDADAETLIAHILGTRRSELYLDGGRVVTPREQAAIVELIERRAGRIPLQLLLGECEFMSLPFKMRGGVFIPRPETEVLVETVMKTVGADGGRLASVLDIGTGSGVVGISLATHLHPRIAAATDISLVAVEIARVNAILNGVEDLMRFIVCDSLSAIRERRAEFDVVVCNPPYVESGDIPNLEPEVRDHDPRTALDGGADGLSFIAGLLPRVPSILRAGGLAAFEIGAGQGRSVMELFKQAGLERVEVVRDFSGLDRVVTGRRS